MKKLVLTLSLILVCINFSCEKQKATPIMDPLIKSLNSYIFDIQKMSLSNPNSLSFNNYNNPYENLYNSSDEIIIQSIKNGIITKGDDIKNVFPPELISQFPKINPESLNSETFQIIDQINDIFVLEDVKLSIQAMISIENFIVDNKSLNNDYSELLLGYCTFIRHSLIINSRLRKQTKEDEDLTWKECMRDKANALKNCDTCYLEKFVFTVTWPEALSVWAIDCGIASIIY